MGWPKRPDLWRDDAAPAQAIFVNVVNAIAKFEPVTVCANGETWLQARKALPDHVRVIDLTLNDSWLRDTGPTFVEEVYSASPDPDGPRRRRIAGVHWVFNGWGGLYGSWDNDKLVGRKILEIERVPRIASDIVLEGGSIHVDGEGTLLTTEQCLLNANRNPNLTREQIAAELEAKLGVRKIIWLPRGLYKDEDTDGHIDNFACFARPGVVLLAWMDDENDPQYAISKEAFEVLSSTTDACGRALKIVKLPCPEPMYRTQEEWAGLTEEGRRNRSVGERLAGSYVNFYLPNGGLVVPQFGQPDKDAHALQVLRDVFPEREVIGVQAREILLGGGNIHCITQQQPL